MAGSANCVLLPVGSTPTSVPITGMHVRAVKVGTSSQTENE